MRTGAARSAAARRPRPGRPSSAGSGRPAATRTATSTATRRPIWSPSPTTTPTDGGPEHAVVALVDHNIGITKDVFVGASAERILGQVREMCADDELTWFREEDPGRLRGEVDRHLEITDGPGRPAGRGLARHRPGAGRAPGSPCCRPSTTPPLAEPPAARTSSDLSRDFLASPEAARFGLNQVTADDELASLHFCLSLLLDHAASLPDADPLRWSPAVAGLFLLDWVHRRAVLDMDDAAMLPRVTRAWSAYASRQRGLPEAAADADRHAWSRR